MKKEVLAIFAGAALSCCGATDIFNGGFEFCAPNAAGIAMPVNWVSNRAVTRNGTARLIRDSGCFRNGSFGLLTETEEKGCLFLRATQSLPVLPGDQIEMEIWAKGTGRYRLQYIVYGEEDATHRKFLSTMGAGRVQKTVEDQWKCNKVKLKFVPPKKARGKYDKFWIIPVILVLSDSEIIFDDFKIKTVPGGAIKKGAK